MSSCSNSDEYMIEIQGRVFIGTDRDGGSPSEEQVLMDNGLAYDFEQGMNDNARGDEIESTVSAVSNAHIDGGSDRDFSKAGKLCYWK